VDCRACVCVAEGLCCMTRLGRLLVACLGPLGTWGAGPLLPLAPARDPPSHPFSSGLSTTAFKRARTGNLGWVVVWLPVWEGGGFFWVRRNKIQLPFFLKSL
jgi:hypothetical protein